MKRRIFILCLILASIVFAVSPYGYSLADLFVSLRSGGAPLTHADALIISACSRAGAVLWKAAVPLMLICWTAFICMNRLGWKNYLAFPLAGLGGILLIDVLLYALGGTVLEFNPPMIVSFAKLFGIIIGGLAVVQLFEWKRHKNSNRRISVPLLFALISILLFSAGIPGLVTAAKKQTQQENLLADDICTIFSPEENKSTKIFDSAGNDITDTVRNELSSAYQQNDTDKINAYADLHIAKVVQTFEDTETVSNGLDISKHQTETITQRCVWNGNIEPDDPSAADLNNDGYIRYSVRATIFYNPNTFVISSAANPVRTTDITAIGWRNDLHPQIGAEGYSHGPGGKISATFNYWVQIEAYLGPKNTSLATLSYGSYPHSFNVEPD